MSTKISPKSGSMNARAIKISTAIFLITAIVLATAPSLAQAKPKKSEIKSYQERGGITRFEEYLPLSPELGAPPGSFYKVNVYVINLKEGIVLVDCGSESLYSELRQEIGKRFPHSSILAVLLTHGHADHAGAGHYFVEEGMPVYASVADSYLIQMGMNFPGVPSDFAYTGYTPTELLYGGETIFGLQVIPTPGHTYGSLSFLHVKTRTLFTGDTTICYPEDDRDPLDMTFELESMTLQMEDEASLHLQLNSLNSLLELANGGSVKEILPGHNRTYHGKDVLSYLEHSIVVVTQALSPEVPPA
ncbi:MAG: MBL fold metallo-hydrolase [Candidatus Hadarchaeum sp.]|uniref:MBL fold metallo-hydrolase n=1 Tax=Candidatus Hadarchaeum sp. TaxID=2883567 RepID=UPI003D0EDFC7